MYDAYINEHVQKIIMWTLMKNNLFYEYFLWENGSILLAKHFSTIHVSNVGEEFSKIALCSLKLQHLSAQLIFKSPDIESCKKFWRVILFQRG